MCNFALSYNYHIVSMTTDSGWDNEMTTVDGGNSFTDITLMGGHEHGYCDLYRARKHGKWHILKTLKSQYRDTPACQTMLRKEFDIGYQLSHPGIAATLGLEQVADLGECIIEEWVDGIRLDDFIARDGFTAEAARDLVKQLCDVLKYIHARQVIHRDLKPSNILITADGDRVKVIDFGVSDTASYAILKGPAGTRDYAAPELLAGEKSDSRADIYSLGVIINLMNEHLSHPDRSLDNIAKCCVVADREQRPTAAQVRESIDSRSSHARLYTFALLIVAAVALAAILFFWPQSTPLPTTPLPASPTTPVIVNDCTTTSQPKPEGTTKQVGTIAAPATVAPPPVTAPSPDEQNDQEKVVTLPANLRQLFLAKAASMGMSSASDFKEELDEVLRLQGKEAFDRYITEYLKKRIEGNLMTVAVEMFQHKLGHNKVMREFLLTAEGHKLMDAGRKTAFEYAHDRLQNLYPDENIPPFPNDKVNWFE